MVRLCNRYGKDVPYENIELKNIDVKDPKKLTQKLKSALNSGWVICGFYDERTMHLERIRKKRK